MNDRLMNILSNIVRVGVVDGIDDKKGTVRVVFPDRDNLVVTDLAMLDSEQRYPDIGSSALCLFLPNGIQEGFCLGSYFNEENLPPVLDEDFYVKKLDDGLTIKYNKQSKKLTIDATNEITINGDLRINGKLNGQVVV